MSATITQSMITAAKQSQSEYGVPASITLGQIVLESSGTYPNGLSGLAYKANNLFGIKATSSWSGDVYEAETKEEDKGVLKNTIAKFKKYASQDASIEDHAKLLTNSRYSKYVNSNMTYKEYAYGLQSAGYATDSNYASKLTNIIKSNNFDKYDTSVTSTKSATDTTDKNNGLTGNLGDTALTSDADKSIGFDVGGIITKVFTFLTVMLIIGIGVFSLLKTFDTGGEAVGT